MLLCMESPLTFSTARVPPGSKEMQRVEWHGLPCVAGTLRVLADCAISKSFNSKDPLRYDIISGP